MKTPTNAHSTDHSLPYTRVLLWAMALSCTVLWSQDASSPSTQTTPALSATTLKILEAQSQATFESPTTKTPDESQLTTKKKRKVETGGLLKEWFAPFERKKKGEQKDNDSTPNTKRRPIWTWFDPTAPLTDAETKSKPIDWKGRRVVPQSFGSPQKTDPDGLKLFFIRYK